MSRLIETVRRSTTVLVALLIMLGLLLIQLGNLVTGVSRREVSARQLSLTLHTVAHHAVYWHYNLLMWLFGWIPGHQTWTIRLASVVYALVAIAALTYVIRHWYGHRTAILGFAVVVCSAWILHNGRLATPDIALLATVAALLASDVFLYDNPDSLARLMTWLVVRLLAFAVPGMFWLILIDVVMHRTDLRLAFGALHGWVPKTMLGIVAVVLLLPIASGLVFGAGRHDGLALLGLPAQLPTISHVASTAKQTLLMISIHGNTSNDAWLNHLPLLGPFLTASLIIGIYFYARHPKATRSRLLLAYTLVILALICASGPVSFSALVPILYLLVAGGIAYLLHRWLKVFPRNPLARMVGIGLIGLAVTLSCSYNLRQYFVAWQHHPEAVSSFQPEPLPRSRL